MKRWLIAALLLLTPLPALAAEKSNIELSAYSVKGVTATLAFSIDASEVVDSVRIIVDPTIVATRSALNDQSQVDGDRFTFPIIDQNRIELSIRVPSLTKVGAHRASAEVMSGGRTLARTQFFISSLTGKGVLKTPVTWFWPITDRPHRGLDNVFLDDQLATDLGQNGRLTRLVRAGAGNNVVWVLDPELLASIEQMALGYQVRRGGELIDGEGQEFAAAWLESLRLATVSRDVLVLPYADPDLASISGADLGALRTYARSTISRILNRSDFSLTSDIGWPSDQRLTSPLMAALRQSDFNAVLLSNSAFAADPAAIATPASILSPTQGITPLLADSGLTKALSQGNISGATRLLAEIATITGERPADQRIQLLLPPRQWNPDDSALTTLLSALRAQEEGLTHLRNQRPEQIDGPTFNGKAYSESFTSALLSMTTKVLRTQAALGADYEPSIDRYMRAFTAINANFRTLKSTLVTALDKSASAYVNTLRILPGRYTLTGKEQSIPLTIVNGFDRPVTLSVDAQPHAPRVVIRGTTSVEIPANGRTQLQVPVTSVAAGLVAVDAYLLTSDGQRYGDGAVLNLDVRNIGPIGNWILYGSVALLALALGLRLTRHIRRRRA